MSDTFDTTPGGARLALLVLASGMVWILVVAALIGFDALLLVPLAILAGATVVLWRIRSGLVLVLFACWIALIIAFTATITLTGDFGSALEIIPYALIVVVPFSTLVFAVVVGPPLLVENLLRRVAAG